MYSAKQYTACIQKINLSHKWSLFSDQATFCQPLLQNAPIVAMPTARRRGYTNGRNQRWGEQDCCLLSGVWEGIHVGLNYWIGYGFFWVNVHVIAEVHGSTSLVSTVKVFPQNESDVHAIVCSLQPLYVNSSNWHYMCSEMQITAKPPLKSAEKLRIVLI